MFGSQGGKIFDEMMIELFISIGLWMLYSKFLYSLKGIVAICALISTSTSSTRHQQNDYTPILVVH